MDFKKISTIVLAATLLSGITSVGATGGKGNCTFPASSRPSKPVLPEEENEQILHRQGAEIDLLSRAGTVPLETDFEDQFRQLPRQDAVLVDDTHDVYEPSTTPVLPEEKNEQSLRRQGAEADLLRTGTITLDAENVEEEPLHRQNAVVTTEMAFVLPQAVQDDVLLDTGVIFENRVNIRALVIVGGFKSVSSTKVFEGFENLKTLVVPENTSDSVISTLRSMVGYGVNIIR